MPVETVLKEYSDNLPKWLVVRAFVEEDITYLPRLLRKIDQADKSEENIERNNEYRDGAVLINVTKRTHDGMVGAVFRKEPVIELPNSIEYIKNNADGSGMSLEQFSRRVLSNTMQTGRDGILVDFPEPLENASKEETKGRQAVMVEYKAESIINWECEGGKLSLVVLKEKYKKAVDEFYSTYEDMYRELRLVDGVYYQRIWKDGAPSSQVVVRDYNGAALKEITFSFVGTINNNPEIDQSLLYSIACINKGHYRNSADLEENCFVHGQLTLGVTSSLSSEEWATSNPRGVKVGARKGHFLGASGGFTSIQAEPNQLADALMVRKETQMVMLGARLIQQGGNEREVAVLSRVGAETATLSSLAANVSSAISRCLLWAEAYMSPSTSDNVFELNKDFFPKSFDAQQIMALIQLYDRGSIGATDLHQNLQAASIISDQRGVEDIYEENGERDPMQSTVINVG